MAIITNHSIPFLRQLILIFLVNWVCIFYLPHSYAMEDRISSQEVLAPASLGNLHVIPTEIMVDFVLHYLPKSDLDNVVLTSKALNIYAQDVRKRRKFTFNIPQNTEFLKNLRLSLSFPFSYIRYLTELKINKVKLEKSDVCLIKNTCLNLKRLILTNCQLGPDHGDILSQIETITHLDLGQNALDDESAIKLSKNLNLRKLNLWLNKISDAGATAIAQHPHLEKIDLSFNEIMDAGITALHDYSKAQHINIVNNPYNHRLNWEGLCLEKKKRFNIYL